MARSFASASQQYLSAASSLDAKNMTMAFWFRTSDDSVMQPLLEVASIVDPNQWLRVCASGGEAGNPIVMEAVFPHLRTKTTSGFSVNTWHHVAAALDLGYWRAVYLDGGSAGENNEIGAVENTNTLYMGRTSSGVYGDIDLAEVAIWEHPLTPEEIATLALGYSPLLVRPDRLSRYWPLGGLYGQSDAGFWVKPHNATPYNSPTWTDHPPILYPSMPMVSLGESITPPTDAASLHVAAAGMWRSGQVAGKHEVAGATVGQAFTQEM